MNKVSVYGGVVHGPGPTKAGHVTMCRPAGHSGPGGYTEFRDTSAAITCKRCLKVVRDADHEAALAEDRARTAVATGAARKMGTLLLSNCPICAKATADTKACAECTADAGVRPAGTFLPDGTINAELADAKVAQAMRPDPMEALLDMAFPPEPADRPIQVRDLVTRKGEPDGPLGRVLRLDAPGQHGETGPLAYVSFSSLPAQWYRVPSLEHARRHYARDAFVGPAACGVDRAGRVTTGEEDRVTCQVCRELLTRARDRQRALYAAQQSCTGCNNDTCTLHGMTDGEDAPHPDGCPCVDCMIESVRTRPQEPSECFPGCVHDDWAARS